MKYTDFIKSMTSYSLTPLLQLMILNLIWGWSAFANPSEGCNDLLDEITVGISMDLKIACPYNVPVKALSKSHSRPDVIGGLDAFSASLNREITGKVTSVLNALPKKFTGTIMHAIDVAHRDLVFSARGQTAIIKVEVRYFLFLRSSPSKVKEALAQLEAGVNGAMLSKIHSIYVVNEGKDRGVPVESVDWSSSETRTDQYQKIFTQFKAAEFAVFMIDHSAQGGFLFINEQLYASLRELLPPDLKTTDVTGFEAFLARRVEIAQKTLFENEAFRVILPDESGERNVFLLPLSLALQLFPRTFATKADFLGWLRTREPALLPEAPIQNHQDGASLVTSSALPEYPFSTANFAINDASKGVTREMLLNAQGSAGSTVISISDQNRLQGFFIPWNLIRSTEPSVVVDTLEQSLLFRLSSAGRNAIEGLLQKMRKLKGKDVMPESSVRFWAPDTLDRNASRNWPLAVESTKPILFRSPTAPQQAASQWLFLPSGQTPLAEKVEVFDDVLLFETALDIAARSEVNGFNQSSLAALARRIHGYLGHPESRQELLQFVDGIELQQRIQSISDTTLNPSNEALIRLAREVLAQFPSEVSNIGSATPGPSMPLPQERPTNSSIDLTPPVGGRFRLTYSPASLKDIERIQSDGNLLQTKWPQVYKALRILGEMPNYNSLCTKSYKPDRKFGGELYQMSNGQPVFESYIDQGSGGYRIWWHYTNGSNGSRAISILHIKAHPKDV